MNTPSKACAWYTKQAQSSSKWTWSDFWFLQDTQQFSVQLQQVKSGEGGRKGGRKNRSECGLELKGCALSMYSLFISYFFSCHTLSKATTVFGAESDTEAPPRQGTVLSTWTCLSAAQDVTQLSSSVGEEGNDTEFLWR